MHRQHRYMHSHRKVDQSSSLGRYGCSAAAVYRVYRIELHIARCHLGEIYNPQVEPWRSILRGKSLFTNSICCLEGRFVWEISIYRLN